MEGLRMPVDLESLNSELLANSGFIENIARIFHQGGFAVMFSILGTLIVSLAIICERTFRYWVVYDLIASNSFMSSIQKLVMNNSIENAIRHCKQHRPKLLPYVLSEGLKRANDSAQEVENALHHATMSVVPKITKTVPLLGTTANVATLLGLLGTIFGLMKSFGGAAKASGAEKQAILAEGIAEALTATSFGLSTALLCLFAYGVLNMKQQALLNDINANVARLTDLLFTRRVKLKGLKK